jgi:hypothetical protein
MLMLSPVFKHLSKEKLSNWELDFSPSKWVAIKFPFREIRNLDNSLLEIDFDENELIEFNVNRYDVSYFDDDSFKTFNVFLYYDESTSKLIAIDEVAEDLYTREKYLTMETPFANLLK